jgi:trk system potassium uptake protein TrkH
MGIEAKVVDQFARNRTSSQPVSGLPRRVMIPAGIMTIAALTLKFGFAPVSPYAQWIHWTLVACAGAYAFDGLAMLRNILRQERPLRSRGYEFALLASFAGALLLIALHHPWIEDLLSILDLPSHGPLALESCEVFLLGNVVIRALRYQQRLLVQKIRPEWFLVGSFAALILIGTLLLLMPRASRIAEQPVTPAEAFFTATSAACVTGLVVRDPGADFSALGQTIILSLIQVGGLGIMTFVAFLAFTSSSPLHLANSLALRKLVNTGSLAELRRHVRIIVLFTLLVETCGAALLFLFLPEDTDPLSGLGWSVFHSVSAFCNAGFALQSDSLVSLRHSPGMLLTFMALITLGSLGFLVITDLLGLQLSRLPLISRIPAVRRFNQGSRVYRLPLQTRLSVLMTVALVVLGTVGYWVLQSAHAPHGQPFTESLWAAAFQSVTTRTAGFNSVDIGSLQTTTLMLLMALMVVGACPVSTGGGMKTVTFGVLILSLRTLLTGRDRVEIFGRALPQKVVFAALSVSLLYLAAAAAGTFALALFDPQISLRDELFEVISALSTVGLSTGITTQLSTPSQFTLCALMFIGRVGPLSLVLSVFQSQPKIRYQYPEEDLVVG